MFFMPFVKNKSVCLVLPLGSSSMGRGSLGSTDLSLAYLGSTSRKGANVTATFTRLWLISPLRKYFIIHFHFDRTVIYLRAFPRLTDSPAFVLLSGIRHLRLR